MTHPLCCCAGSCLPQGQRRRPSPTSTVSSTASPPAARRESRSRPPPTWRMYAWPPPPSLTLSHSRRRSEPAVEVEPCAASTSPVALALKRLDDLVLDLVPFPPFSSVSPPAPWSPSAASVVRSYPPLSPRSFGLEAGRRPRSLWDSSRNPVLGAPTAQRVKPEITFPVGNLRRKTRTSQFPKTSNLDFILGSWSSRRLGAEHR